MRMNDNEKQDKLAQMSTRALERIAKQMGEPVTSTPEYPLVGVVRIEGIGNVSKASIRAELDRRTLDVLGVE